MPTLAKGLVEQVLALLKPAPKKDVPEASRIRVHATISRFAVVYERVRNVVDYKDEHLLRKAAIIRILKRQFLLERDPSMIALNLVKELIGAKYLPNDELPEQLSQTVAASLRKYLVIEQANVGSASHRTWLLGIVAAEIEDLLVDSGHEKGAVTFLYERLADRIRVRGTELSQDDLRLQAYLASYRMLLKADADILGYKLIRAYLPEWLRPEEWLAAPQPIAERLVGIERKVQAALQHPLAPKFQKAIKPWSVPLNLLVRVLREKPVDVKDLLEHPEKLSAEIGKAAEKQYEVARAKLRRGALRAMVYLLATKMLVALLIEVPLETLLYKEFAVSALLINLLFPPLLMFLVSLLIKVPGKENAQQIEKNALALLSSDPLPELQVRVEAERSAAATLIFGGLYFLTFVLSFGFVGYVLSVLNFTWISASIFFFFLCVVSFFAFRLRMNAREQVIVASAEKGTSLLIDLISLPILRVGQWLSRSISRLNVFLFFLDFLFEAPFKIFLSVLEGWFGYLKEKKEEIQ